VAELRAKLDAMLPGVRDQLANEKRQALTTDEQQLLDTPAEQLSSEQNQTLYGVQEKIEVSDRDVAERIAREQPANANRALQLASELERTDMELRYTINYKRDANYDYWQTRADFEQTDNAIAARRFMYEANNAFRKADVQTARRLYEQGFAKWREVIDAFPAIMDDEATTGDDIVEFVKKYRNVLDQLDEQLGDDFPLWDVLEKFDREQEFTEELADRRERQGQPADGDSSATPAQTQPAADDQPAQAQLTDGEPAEPEPPQASANTDSSPSEPAQPQDATPEPAEPSADR
jgi:hypothetical protein